MRGKECSLLYGTAETAQMGGALAVTGRRGYAWKPLPLDSSVRPLEMCWAAQPPL